MDPTTQPRVDRPVHSIHLMGICGTGMGTLAAMLQEAGYRVRGSDQNVYPPMSTFLASKGIHLIQGYRPENLQPPPDLVVAVPRPSRSEREFAEARAQEIDDVCAAWAAIVTMF